MRGTVVKLIGFVILCGIFTGYLFFTIGNIKLFQPTYVLTGTFEDASGVLKDDNVKVAGVVVGKVTKVSINQGKAVIKMQVRDSTKVPTDTTAAIRWRNLIGQRYIYLYPGQASTMMRDGDHITKSRSVVDIGELFNRLGPIIKAIDPKQVNTFLDAITAALDGNQTKLRQTIDDLAVLAGSLGQRDAQIGRLIENLNVVTGTLVDRDQQVRTVLDNLLELAKTFSANTDMLNGAVTDLGRFSDNFNYLLTNNRGELNRIIINLKTITDVVQAKLPTLDHAVAGLDEAAKRLSNSSRDGEWLNQLVPCGAFQGPTGTFLNTYTVAGCTTTVDTATNRPLVGGVPANVPLSGTAAVTQLMGGAR